MKANNCKTCKGNGRFIQPTATIKGSKSAPKICPRIVDHYEEARAVLEEVNDIYNRTAATGKERPFIREVYALLARNNIGRRTSS